MRALRVKQRNVLMTHVRGYFRNASHNPFAFETEYARVISGEEEGAYGWAAINYLAGNLQADSAGSGTRVVEESIYILAQCVARNMCTH